MPRIMRKLEGFKASDDDMHIAEVLKENMVWAELGASTKDGVIREMSELIASREPHLEPKALYQALVEREKLGSTGIEDGIAIPHAKVQGVDRVLVACGRSSVGLDFDAHDEKPTHLFFVLLAPANATGQHLKVLARLSRLLKESRVRSRLLDAITSDDLYHAIVDEDGKL